MFRKLISAVWLALLLACGGGGSSTPVLPTPKSPVVFTRSAEGGRAMLVEVAEQGRTIAGQQCGDGDDIEAKFEAGVVALERLTGRTVGLVGADYGWRPQ